MPLLVEATAADEYVQRALSRTFLRDLAATRRPAAPVESDWQTWLRTLFPAYLTDSGGQQVPFAPHHAAFWEWVWALRRTERPRPFVAIWPRGGAKSTSAELACVAVGARLVRRYALYVCATQEQADDHVGNVGAMLESPAVGRYYPALAGRLVGKFGNSRGWRRNRLRTASGFTLDAIGLDTASRGAKLDEDRPDFLIFDDIDNDRDSTAAVEKKLGALTRRLVPAGAADVAVLAVQNLVHPDSVFARLADGRADFLADRVVSGPFPAVEALTYEERDGRHVITGGAATWAGMDLTRCQRMLDDMGITAFLAECQHLVSVLQDRVFRREWWTGDQNRYDAADQRHVNRCLRRWLSFDTAIKDGDEHDWTACGVYELWPDYRVAVREVWWDKLETPDLLARIEQTAVRYNEDGKLSKIVIEDKGSGTTALQSLRRAAPAWLSPLLYEYQPHGSKEYRARQASIWCARNRVLLPYPNTVVPWLPAFEDALYRFPNTPLKDPIDQLSQMLLWLEPAYLEPGWREWEREAARLVPITGAAVDEWAAA